MLYELNRNDCSFTVKCQMSNVVQTCKQIKNCKNLKMEMLDILGLRSSGTGTVITVPVTAAGILS